MSASKQRFVEDLKPGDEAADIFVLSAARLSRSKNGPYWLLEFKDATGSITGKIWSPQSGNYTDLAPGAMVWVKGRVGSWRDKPDLSVDELRVLDEAEQQALDMALFMPASQRNPDDMLRELTGLARSTLTHAPWRKLIFALLTDPEIAPALRIAPAAKSLHHAYAGGLLEHTLSVARLCLRIADHYPQLDRQALFAGAVCHDLGKLRELSSGPAVDYTTPGRLIGHIGLFTDMLCGFVRQAGLEEALAQHLEHMILSHHGSYEFGAPRLPATAEALALHYADMLDAKLKQVEDALTGIEEDGWSDYNAALERFLYRAPASPSPTPEGVSATPASPSPAPAGVSAALGTLPYASATESPVARISNTPSAQRGRGGKNGRPEEQGLSLFSFKR
ncbi:MAG: HD domain-containing protein [Desulfovibrio sp.]|jgi:3'-5' exoribonuclease|nr:HD domain-containing protein [Desulfovibrio sp.]